MEFNMSAMTEYTLEIYKADRRVKGGYRLIEKKDFAPVTKDYIDSVARGFNCQGYIVKIFETYVTILLNLIGVCNHGIYESTKKGSNCR